uniref:Uncharacterized protein n=1 Tax=Hyaloperonospora arabidopsidis (strain Emoy2) TaxID=559515 RepID=M4BPG0_HYAAE
MLLDFNTRSILSLDQAVLYAPTTSSDLVAVRKRPRQRISRTRMIAYWLTLDYA